MRNNAPTQNVWPFGVQSPTSMLYWSILYTELTMIQWHRSEVFAFYPETCDTKQRRQRLNSTDVALSLPTRVSSECLPDLLSSNKKVLMRYLWPVDIWNKPIENQKNMVPLWCMKSIIFHMLAYRYNDRHPR